MNAIEQQNRTMKLGRHLYSMQRNQKYTRYTANETADRNSVGVVNGGKRCFVRKVKCSRSDLKGGSGQVLRGGRIAYGTSGVKITIQSRKQKAVGQRAPLLWQNLVSLKIDGYISRRFLSVNTLFESSCFSMSSYFSIMSLMVFTSVVVDDRPIDRSPLCSIPTWWLASSKRHQPPQRLLNDDLVLFHWP